LSCNRFGTFLGLAHAAMTAEGDNSVLMQKVAKERLAALQKQGFPTLVEANQDLGDNNYCLRLLQMRERALFERLGKAMVII
jgi:acyl-CoA oxidase